MVSVLQNWQIPDSRKIVVYIDEYVLLQYTFTTRLAVLLYVSLLHV